MRFAILILSVIGIALTSACLGSQPFSPGKVIQAILGGDGISPVHQQIITDFRLPRIATALLAGSALATAGLIMQTVFRNPLADPFVLGVNSGASLGVALVLMVLAPTGIRLTQDLNLTGQSLVIIGSTGGAFLTLLIALFLSRRVDVMSLLIVGLMVSYTVGAMVSILMFFSMAERLQAFLNWSFGNYGNVSWQQMPVFAILIIGGLSLTALFLKPLDALLIGSHYAESLGTNTRRVRFFSLLAASILAGTVTGFCGPIGFLGIAAPHLSRYLFKTSRHLVLVPATILVGAGLSLSADLVSKAPGLDATLPLNAITALIGAPVIIVALIRQRNLKRVFG